MDNNKITKIKKIEKLKMILWKYERLKLYFIPFLHVINS